jgi:hypothetical protein
MSIVAGFSMFSSVALVSDCRATLFRPGRPNLYADNVQKLFPLAPHTAVGFVGDIGTAAHLLPPLLTQARMIDGDQRGQAIALLSWLPRFLRFRYAQRTRASPFAVMVASVIRSRSNVVERARVIELLDRFRLGKLSHQRSWLPDVLVRILQTPPDCKVVTLAHAPAGLLYTLAAPRFAPRFFRPLSATAIGSGDGAVSQFDIEADWIFAGDVGNPFMETMAIQNSVARHVHESGLTSVGGLFPTLRLSADGMSAHGFSAEIPIGGDKIELRPLPSGRWEQRHHNSGTVIPLQYPWEFDPASVTADLMFDYLRDANKRFAGDSENRD